MKDLLKSKVMMGFVIFILGVVYINSVSIKNEVKMNANENNQQLVYNK